MHIWINRTIGGAACSLSLLATGAGITHADVNADTNGISTTTDANGISTTTTDANGISVLNAERLILDTTGRVSVDLGATMAV